MALVTAEAGWQVDWAPAALAPDLAEGDTLGLRTLTPAAATSPGRAVRCWSPSARSCATGSTRPRSRGRRSPAARVGSPASSTSTWRRTSSARRRWGPRPSSRRSCCARTTRSRCCRRFRKVRARSPCATRCRSRRRGSSPRRCSAASAPRPPRSSRTSEGRIVAGDEVGLSGLQARYDDQLRGLPGTAVVARDADDQLRTLVRGAGDRRRRPGHHARPRRSSRRPSRRWPPSAPMRRRRPRRDPAVRRRGPGHRQRRGGGGADLADDRAVRTRLDVQGGQLARPAAQRAASPATGCPARRRRSSTGARSRTTTTTRRPRSATSPSPRRSPSPATPPSSATPTGSPRRPGRSRAGARARHRPRPRLPGLLRPGAAAGDRDGRRGRHDRPGHRAGQPLRDGDGRRVGRRRSRRAAGAAAGHRGASRCRPRCR